MATHDLHLSESFRRWRRVTRWFLVAGVAGLVAAYQFDDPLARFILIVLAGVLCVAVVPLYFNWCNRCPRCNRSFSDAPEFKSDETNGLPLFNKLDRCPFCSLGLDSERGYV